MYAVDYNWTSRERIDRYRLLLSYAQGFAQKLGIIMDDEWEDLYYEYEQELKENAKGKWDG